MPEWLVGDWTPIDIRQSADMVYASNTEDPKHWLAGQHLLITASSFTFADHRCEGSAVEFRRASPNIPLHRHGGGLLDSYDFPLPGTPIDYVVINCARELYKLKGEATFMAQKSFSMPIPFFMFIRSHNEIDMPFFAGAYVKFRKTAPTS